MNIIITMAGIGSRFSKAGYNCPKYMIEAKGKTLFEWALDSLLDYNRYVNEYFFVVRKENDAVSFIREKCSKYNIGHIKIIELDHHTDGQATTALLAVEECASFEPVMVYNIDTYVEPYTMKYNDLRGDGYIPCFKAKGDHWSFVRTDQMGHVLEVREKERISDFCTVGAYFFSSANLYQKIYEEFWIQQNHTKSNERYIAPMYNYMIACNYEVTMDLLPEKKVHVLGTPEELQVFLDMDLGGR